MKWVVRLGSVAGTLVFVFALIQALYYFAGGEFWLPTVRSDTTAPQTLSNYVG